MDISLLKTFLEVVRTRHFGHAADHLYITQSAVSARIKMIESLLGVQLFVRKRNDLQLTPAGAKLKQHAETIVKGWERARLEISLDPEIEGLVVGCTTDLWNIFVLTWVKTLSQKAPHITVQVEAQGADMLSQRLISGVLDCCYLFDPPQASGLLLRHAFDTNLRLVSTRRGLVRGDVFNLKNYYMVNWGSAFQTKHSEYFPELTSPTAVFSSGSMALDILLKEGGVPICRANGSRVISQ